MDSLTDSDTDSDTDSLTDSETDSLVETDSETDSEMDSEMDSLTDSEADSDCDKLIFSSAFSEVKFSLDNFTSFPSVVVRVVSFASTVSSANTFPETTVAPVKAPSAAAPFKIVLAEIFFCS